MRKAHILAIGAFRLPGILILASDHPMSLFTSGWLYRMISNLIMGLRTSVTTLYVIRWEVVPQMYAIRYMSRSRQMDPTDSTMSGCKVMVTTITKKHCHLARLV